MIRTFESTVQLAKRISPIAKGNIGAVMACHELVVFHCAQRPDGKDPLVLLAEQDIRGPAVLALFRLVHNDNPELTYQSLEQGKAKELVEARRREWA